MASGLDSKITPITPIGHDSLINNKSVSSSLFICTLPSGSGNAIKSRMPFTTSFILSSLNFNLFNIGAAIPSSFAFSKSVSFAFLMFSLLAIIASAIAISALFLSSNVRADIFELSNFIFSACVLISIFILHFYIYFYSFL